MDDPLTGPDNEILLCSAANNLAIAALHAGNVVEAVDVFEAAIQANPPQMLRRDVVSNLCLLYDLSKDGAGARRSKLVMQRVAGRYGLDHIPASAFRL